MYSSSFTRLGFCSVMLVAAAACSSGADRSVQNPNFFIARVSDANMNGTFNPNGFDTQQVQNLAAETCEGGQLSGFSTAAGENGLTNFTATCGVWKDNAKLVEFERSSGTTVVIEISGSQSGNLTYNRIDVDI